MRQYSFSRTLDSLIQANIFTVVLDSIKIHGIISAGRFVQEPLQWTVDSTVTSDYTVFSSNKGLELGCDRYDNPILTQLRTMLLIPQTLLKTATLEEWHHVNVRTSVTNKDSGKIKSDETYTLYKSSVLPLSRYCTGWQMDLKYTFRLAVGADMEESDIATAVTDWVETREIILGDE